MSGIKIVHYVNQFHGQIGGEDQAGVAPHFVDRPVGVGSFIQQQSGDRYRVVRTVICGDNYAGENLDILADQVLPMVREAGPELFIAGPSFASGRYGSACGVLCKAVQEKLGLPAVTAMHPDNPGVDLSRPSVYVVEAGKSAADMKNVMPKIISLADKLLAGEAIGLPPGRRDPSIPGRFPDRGGPRKPRR